MMAVIRLDRHLHGRDVGCAGIVMLHRLRIVVDIRRAVGAAGFREELIRRDRLLMIDRRCDVACQLGVFGSTLIVAPAMEGLSGIALMGLGQREIFARRRRRRDTTVMFVADVGEAVRVFKRGPGVGVRSIVMLGRMGLRDQILIGLRSIREIGMPLGGMQTDIGGGPTSVIVLSDVRAHVAGVILSVMALSDVQSHVTGMIVAVLVLTNMQSHIAGMIVGTLILSDMQSHVAGMIMAVMVLAGVQPDVALTSMVAAILARMQSCVAAINVVHCAGLVSSAVVGRRCCGNLIGATRGRCRSVRVERGVRSGRGVC